MRKLIIILLLVFILGCVNIDDKKNKTAVEMTKELCEQANGKWNECGSPCAGTGAEICIQVCQAQCECGGIAGFNCPEGFKCRLSGKIADEMGVCVE